MITLSTVLSRWQGLFFLMSQTHYWPLHILSVTKRASPNYLLAWASCLPLLPALVHLWPHSPQKSFILFCVSLQPNEWLDLLHYHTNATPASVVEWNWRVTVFHSKRIYIHLSHPKSPISSRSSMNCCEMCLGVFIFQSYGWAWWRNKKQRMKRSNIHPQGQKRQHLGWWSGLVETPSAQVT